MNTWQIVLLAIAGIYLAVAVGFYLWLPQSPGRVVIALAWPLAVLWMLIGNVK